ncbi:DsbA family protein [Blastococcus mobilis]|uniref:Predicted dithiol-disulfide isomerase, DsbA family n=1 Tax=Blastococcus mobilis TaxID=1938746 RepID=A0A238W207_9ACTN|nr:DsbA family protein [Blastococcus mobilis]SNR40538.1 Predicted dithiol-disulfide isomerase, DsbA family [Blastococcus mobilis]
MKIEVYADVVCAWAYIGKRRLEAALDLLGGQADPVEVIWRPYLIDPTAPVPSEPLEEALRDPVADAALAQCAVDAEPADHRVRVREIARDEGLTPWRPRWRASSWAAHRLLQRALDSGGPTVQGAVVEDLLHTHFLEGRDLNDPAVLAEIATANRLTPDTGPGAHAGYLRGGPAAAADPLERATREQLLRGKALGVASSPTFVVAGRAVAGAQPPEVLVHLLSDSTSEGGALPEEIERLRLGESLLAMGDALGALQLLEPLRATHAGEPNLDILTARAYYASAQLGRARTLLEPLAREKPGDTQLRLLLGRTLQRLGEEDQARVHLRLAEA